MFVVDGSDGLPYCSERRCKVRRSDASGGFPVPLTTEGVPKPLNDIVAIDWLHHVRHENKRCHATR